MKNGDGLCVIMITAIIVAACADFKKKTPSVSLPPLPTAKMPSPMAMRSLVEAPHPIVTALFVKWENPDTPFASNYVTAIEATTDLNSWREVTRFPYQLRGSLQITNQQSLEAFRVFNSIRTSP